MRGSLCILTSVRLFDDFPKDAVYYSNLGATTLRLGGVPCPRPRGCDCILEVGTAPTQLALLFGQTLRVPDLWVRLRAHITPTHTLEAGHNP